MAVKKKTKLSDKKSVRLRDRTDLAWRNFALFLLLFLLSFVLYNFTSSALFKNFFGILSVIFGFLALAILIAFIVLIILKKGKK